MNGPARVMDLQTAFDHGFEAVKKYLDAELGDIRKDIAELKSRPSLEDAGVWNERTLYRPGHVTTHDGSAWVCKQANVNARPGQPGDFWRLSEARQACARQPMTIDAAAVTEVLDLVEREVMKGLVRDEEVALVVELAAETLRVRRPIYLDLTSMWIERQLSTSH